MGGANPSARSEPDGSGVLLSEMRSPDAAARAVSELPRLELPRELARSIAEGHPWIYRDHVHKAFRAPAGSWVRIQAGNVSAVALWDPDSQLALRVFSKTEVPDERWFRARIAEADALRRRTGVTDVASAYRWVAGEGDGLPGVVVDRYGAFAVVVLDTDVLAPHLPVLVDAMKRTADLHGVVRRRRGDGEARLDLLFGRLPPRPLVVDEHRMRFYADLHRGQKTGLFLDQRENRRYVESVARGSTVLNLFGYTGGFSAYAVRGEATHVTTVDIAEDAIASARENLALNGFDPSAHDFVAADVFDYLRDTKARGQRFDLVICDPPSFARSRADRERAVDAYVRLHAAALSVVTPGGLYAASSCSTQVGVDAFHTSLRRAAARVRIRLQVCHDAGHAPDHPIAAGHPEGRYLKFVVGRVLAPV
jgi:23S rRNA (cytosine1962-C5)-methyltransferase